MITYEEANKLGVMLSLDEIKKRLSCRDIEIKKMYLQY